MNDNIGDEWGGADFGECEENQSTASKPIYKVGIIGCGSIGALKPNDLDDPAQDEKILTHAHAVTKHPNLELHYLIEKNLDVLKEAVSKWNPSVACVFLNSSTTITECNIIIVATPTNTHAQVIKEVIEKIKPKLIICEKPFCNNTKEAFEVSTLCREAGVPIAVNYTRAFVPGIRKEIDLIKHGYIYDVTFMYGRGLMHDGCHAVQFLDMFFNKEPRVRTAHTVIEDHIKGDPTISVTFDYGSNQQQSGVARMIGINSRHYGVFDARIVTSEGVFDLVDNGAKVVYRPVMTEKVYGDYPTLSSHQERRDIPLHTGLMALLDNCVDYLDGNAPLYCTDKDAIRIHGIIKNIRRQTNVQTCD